MTFWRTKNIAAAGALFYSFLAPLISFAQTVQSYVPLAPLGNIPASQAVTPEEYIPYLFKVGIGIAGGLAVLSIAFAGLQWMMSDVATSKSAAKDRIRNSLLGLLLAIGCFLLLKTINPDLVSIRFGPSVDLPPGVGGGPSPTTTGDYRLSYYKTTYNLNVQVYDYELRYINSDNNVVRIRYRTSTDCQTNKQRVESSTSILPGSGATCARVQAADASSCPYNVEMINASSCPAKDPVPQLYDALDKCNSNLANITGNDKYEVIGTPCAPTTAAQPTTNIFSTLTACQETERLIDPMLVTASCSSNRSGEGSVCTFDSDCTDPNYSRCDLSQNKCVSPYE